MRTETCVPEPAADDPDRLRLSVEVRTARAVVGGTLRRLTHEQWMDRSRRLDELGETR